MNRRDSLRALVVGGLSAAVLVDACKTPAGKDAGTDAQTGADQDHPERMAEEKAFDKNYFRSQNSLLTMSLRPSPFWAISSSQKMK